MTELPRKEAFISIVPTKLHWKEKKTPRPACMPRSSLEEEKTNVAVHVSIGRVMCVRVGVSVRAGVGVGVGVYVCVRGSNSRHLVAQSHANFFS